MPEWALKMEKHIEESLRKAHPSWSNKRIESAAHGAVVNKAKEMGKKNPWTSD